LNVKAQHAIKSHFDISVKGTLIFFIFRNKSNQNCVLQNIFELFMYLTMAT